MVKTGELEDGTAEQMKEGSLVRESKRRYMKLRMICIPIRFMMLFEIEVQTNLLKNHCRDTQENPKVLVDPQNQKSLSEMQQAD